MRELNLYQEGDITPYDDKLEGVTIGRCWHQLLSDAYVEDRRKTLMDFNHTNRWKKRGLAIVPVKFGISFSETFLNQV